MCVSPPQSSDRRMKTYKYNKTDKIKATRNKTNQSLLELATTVSANPAVPPAWIRCCNSSCGKWRMIVRPLERGDIELSRDNQWFCVQNWLDEKNASCAAPQERLPDEFELRQGVTKEERLDKTNLQTIAVKVGKLPAFVKTGGGGKKTPAPAAATAAAAAAAAAATAVADVSLTEENVKLLPQPPTLKTKVVTPPVSTAETSPLAEANERNERNLPILADDKGSYKPARRRNKS